MKNILKEHLGMLSLSIAVIVVGILVTNKYWGASYQNPSKIGKYKLIDAQYSKNFEITYLLLNTENGEITGNTKTVGNNIERLLFPPQ